jgi:hypothetical protein
MNKKLIWGIVIAVILMIGFCLLYFPSPLSPGYKNSRSFPEIQKVKTDSNPVASADMANWKTYTSKYHLTFKYPSDWKVIEPTDTEVNQIVLQSPETQKSITDFPYKNDIYVGIHGYKDLAYNPNGAQNGTFAGMNALKFTDGSYIVDNKNLNATYLFSVTAPQSEIKQQILSSFKFTN